MRVLCVTNMYPGPSDPDYGAFVERMCVALDELGHDVQVAAIDSRRSGPIRTPRKYLRLLAETARKARWADVLYAHYLVPTGVIAVACGALTGRPTVVTAHGGDVALAARWLPRTLAAWAVTRAAATIAVSNDLREQLVERLGTPADVHVINMGVDLDRFVVRDRADARARLGLDSAPLVLAVGGLTSRKNPVALMQAISRLARHPDARLVLVGDGPLRPTLELARARLGLEAAVTLTGAIPHDQVADWMAACDVLALVSTREPLGIVALEALASGRPVVATAVGGTPEIVPSSGPGRIVDPRSPDAIADAIADVLADPPSPTSCRDAARPSGLDRQAAAVADVLGAAVGRTGERAGSDRTPPPNSG